MHKFVMKFFENLKNCAEFLKIATVFCIMMHLLYWIQHLIGSFWGWMNFITPLLDLFIDFGESISKGAITLFGAIFQFKFFIALLAYLVLYGIFHIIYLFICSIENFYCDGRMFVNKKQEEIFNKSMEYRCKTEQKKIKNYYIYVSAFLKERIYNGKEINIEEQNKIMIKFLVDKTGVSPIRYKDGYLFTFRNFEYIDNILDIFFKLPKSKAPLDYVICVQILGENYRQEEQQLNSMINLKLKNKLIMCADTLYRYGFNEINKYFTSQIGLFKNEDKEMEVHEFYL